MERSSETVPYASARGRGALLASVLGSGLAFLDATAVNVALHALGRDLGTGLTGLQWAVDAYLLTLGALVLTGGALGDVYGQRRVFLAGLAAFSLTSIACGLAWSVGSLAVARAAQGIGAALLVPSSLAMLRTSFSEEERGRAVAAWAGFSGVSTAIGPLLGGWLVDAWSWRAVFFLNLPLAAVAAWAGWRFPPQSSRAGDVHSVDLAGAITASLGLGCLVLSLIEGPPHGWPPVMVASAVMGVGMLGLFLFLQARGAHPMLPLRLFRSRTFVGANLTTLTVYFALGGTTFFVVLALQQELGYSALEAGASLLPITLLLLLLSPAVGRLTERVGARALMTLGPLVVGGGLMLLTRLEPGGSYLRTVLPGVIVLGAGLTLTVGPLTTVVLGSVNERYAGIASGFNNAVARIAGLLAVALLPSLSGLIGRLGVDFLAGVRHALWVSAVLCAIGGLCSLALVSGREAPHP